MFADGTGSRRSCCLRALFGKSPRGNSPLGDESLPAARLHCEAAVDRRFRASGARSAEPKRGAGNAVYDPVGQKIGSAEEVFVNRDGEPVVRQGTHWPPLDENGADTGVVRRDRR